MTSLFFQRYDKDHFLYAHSQWEMTLQCNIVSHWLGAHTKWSLYEIVELHGMDLFTLLVVDTYVINFCELSNLFIQAIFVIFLHLLYEQCPFFIGLMLLLVIFSVLSKSKFEI